MEVLPPKPGMDEQGKCCHLFLYAWGYLNTCVCLKALLLQSNRHFTLTQESRNSSHSFMCFSFNNFLEPIDNTLYTLLWAMEAGMSESAFWIIMATVSVLEKPPWLTVGLLTPKHQLKTKNSWQAWPSKGFIKFTLRTLRIKSRFSGILICRPVVQNGSEVEEIPTSQPSPCS